MERSRLTGLDIPAELYRIVDNKKRPFMVLHATEPTHPGGVIYEGIKLSDFSLVSDANELVQSINISVTQEELGRRHFSWYPEGIVPKPEDRVPLWMEVFYGGESQRLRIEESKYELLNKIPGVTQEFIERQRAIDATLSLEGRKRKSDPEKEYRKIWEIITQQEKDLSSDDQRALEIRKISLGIANSLDQLLEDPAIKNDPITEAEVIAKYWQGMFRLQELGVRKGMHVGDSVESFNNPTKMAEYVAGQLVEIEDDNLPNIRQILPQIQEHSEGEINPEGSNPNEDRSTFVIPTKSMSPNLKNWIVLRSMVNLTHMFLASGLDNPEPPTPK